MSTQTFTQRRAIRAYNEAHRQAIHCAERAGQPEAVQMCAPVDAEPAPQWLVWTLRVVFSLLLTVIAYELGNLVLVGSAS